MKLPDRWRWKILSVAKGGVEASRRLGVTVGEGCRVLSMNVSSEYDLITLGDRVTVSSDVRFITHDGSGWLVRDPDGKRRYWLAPINVGDDVFIGAGATIMPGVRIGSRCIVAAGAVVAKSVPDGTVVGGNPARKIGDFDAFERKALDSWPTTRAVQSTWKPELS